MNAGCAVATTTGAATGTIASSGVRRRALTRTGVPEATLACGIMGTLVARFAGGVQASFEVFPVATEKAAETGLRERRACRGCDQLWRTAA